MSNSISSTIASAEPIKQLFDHDTGEIYSVVYEDIETVRAGTRAVAITRLVVEPTGVGLVANSQPKKAIPKFVLAYADIWDFFGDLKVSQYEKAVLKFIIRNMTYQNKLQARSSVIADSVGIGRPDVSKAMRKLKEKGIIVEAAKNRLIPDIPVYRVNPRLVFAGQDSQIKRAIAIFDAEMARAHKPTPMLKLIK